MTTEHDMRRFMVKIARKYYEERLTQSEIGERYNLSRQSTQRLLERCRELGIVKIVIESQESDHFDLESALESQYGLKEAVVVDIDPDAYESENGLHAALAEGLVEYLSRTVYKGAKIAVNWSRAINELVSVLSARGLQPVKDLRSVTVVQSLGPLYEKPESLPELYDFMIQLARLLGGAPMLLTAPAMVQLKEDKEAYIRDPAVRILMETLRGVDIALLGIGAVDMSSRVIVNRSMITETVLEELRAAGAVGEINLRYFDREGGAVASLVDERVIGLTLDEMRRIPLVVGVGGGAKKVEAFRAALRGKLLNVLVTDQVTAANLTART